VVDKQKPTRQGASTPLCNLISVFFSLTRMEGRYKLLLESPHFHEETVPIRSTRSSSLDYILHIAPLPSYYAASASFPSNVIDIFDKSSLRGVQTLPGHEEGTTSLHTVEHLGGGAVRTCLVSSGKDGSVKVWDDRLNSHSIKRKVSSSGITIKKISLMTHYKIFMFSDEFWKLWCIALLRCFIRWTYRGCGDRSERCRCAHSILV